MNNKIEYEMMLLRLVTGAPQSGRQVTELWIDTCIGVTDLAKHINERMGKPLSGHVSFEGTGTGEYCVTLRVAKNDDDFRIWDQLIYTATGSRCPE